MGTTLFRWNMTGEPNELEILQRVYKTILREKWFDRSDQNERNFARIIIGFYQRGLLDEELLLAESLSVARHHFSKQVGARERSRSD